MNIISFLIEQEPLGIIIPEPLKVLYNWIENKGFYLDNDALKNE